MDKKSSAHYQREFRRRLREQGLVKKEVWVRPEYVQRLTWLERELRQLEVEVPKKGVRKKMSEDRLWTTTQLYEAWLVSEVAAKKHVTVELIEGVDPSIQITMHDYGDLPLFMNVSGEQIVVDALLWPASAVKSHERFNELVLRTQRMFPLSNISLGRLVSGEDYYQMFGALSARSSLANIIFEVEILADNVIKATEAYEQYVYIQEKVA